LRTGIIFNASLMQNDPSSRLEALLRQGSAPHAQDRLDAAKALYSQAAQLNPSDFRAWYLLGIVALQGRQPREALQFFDEAVRANPRCVEAQIERGNAFARLSQIEAAIESYSRAIDIAPNQSIARHNRGNMLWALRAV
jgi:tetratricopeptide (TPR) repeat protein